LLRQSRAGRSDRRRPATPARPYAPRRPHVDRADLHSLVDRIEAVRWTHGPARAISRAAAGRRPDTTRGRRVRHAGRTRSGAGDLAWLRQRLERRRRVALTATGDVAAGLGPNRAPHSITAE